MGFKDFFIKSEEEKKPEPKVVSKPINRAVVGTPMVPTGAVTDYYKYLNDAMRKKLQEPLCYLDFADALKDLDGQQLTEQQKYVVTFPTYRRAGVTPDKLVASAMKYKEILIGEKRDFDTESKAAYQIGVVDKTVAIERLENEIAQLTKQIQDKSTQIEKYNKEVTEAGNNIKAETQAFDNAMQVWEGTIQNHIDNINKYLNANVTE